MFALLHVIWALQFPMFKTRIDDFRTIHLHFTIMICVWRRRFEASTTTSTFNSSRINWWQCYSFISIVNDNVLYGDFIHFQITALIDVNAFVYHVHFDLQVHMNISYWWHRNKCANVSRTNSWKPLALSIAKTMGFTVCTTAMDSGHSFTNGDIFSIEHFTLRKMRFSMVILCFIWSILQKKIMAKIYFFDASINTKCLIF